MLDKTIMHHNETSFSTLFSLIRLSKTIANVEKSVHKEQHGLKFAISYKLYIRKVGFDGPHQLNIHKHRTMTNYIVWIRGVYSS